MSRYGAILLERLLLPLLGVGSGLLVWHLLCLGNDRSDVPGPLLTAEGLWELAANGLLLKNIVASLFRVGWGFTLAAAVGIPLGLSLGWFRGMRGAVNPLVQMLRPISPIAWLPISTLIFGAIKWFDPSDLAAIFLIFLSALFPIVTSTASSVQSIDLKYLRSARNFGVSGLHLVRTVILPATLPQVLTGLRISLGIAWVVVVAAEMLGVQSGLGYQVNDARNNLRYDIVTAAMVVIAVTGLLLDLFMSRLERTALQQRGMAPR